MWRVKRVDSIPTMDIHLNCFCLEYTSIKSQGLQWCTQHKDLSTCYLRKCNLILAISTMRKCAHNTETCNVKGQGRWHDKDAHQDLFRCNVFSLRIPAKNDMTLWNVQSKWGGGMKGMPSENKPPLTIQCAMIYSAHWHKLNTYK